MLHNHISNVALYGNTAVQRVFCEDCETWTFVRDGLKNCCGQLSGEEPLKIKRESEPWFKRKKPSKAARERIARAQDNKCLYCEQPIGKLVLRKGKPIFLRVNWDHVMPYAWSADNRKENFVLACHVCNGIKASKLFKTLIEAQIYIRKIRREKGYDF